jgi:Tn3 transposase DDE domain
LLEGEAWQAIRADVLTTLGLPESPDALLAEHARTLDAAYREVAGRLAVNTEVRVDDAGKIHLTGVKAVEEPPSLVDLRGRTAAMLPRVDLPEAVLEVMSWVPALTEAFTAVSGGRSRLEDLPTSIAACLAAHSMNVGYRPIAKKGAPARERSRLSHVFQNYFRPETLAAANAPLVARQAGLPLAQAWGGGLVAAVDGMRFVVPVPAAFARPNRKYFGSKRGHDLAERSKRPGDGARSQGRVGDRAGFPAHGRRHLRPGRRRGPRDRRVRHRLLLGSGVRAAGAARDLLPARPGGPARPERLADQTRRQLRPAGHLRPGQDRPEKDPAELGGHPARRRLDLHRHRPGLRRGHHAPARRASHRARRDDRDVRADLQDPAHPQLHRCRRDLPARHQGHPQPAGGTARAGPGRSATGRRAGCTTGTSAWRTR